MIAPAGEYYLQDTRCHVGNSMLWWAKDHKGYVCDIRKAHVFTHVELRDRHRDTDVAWPKAYIDERISHHIDMQHCDPSEKSIRNPDPEYDCPQCSEITKTLHEGVCEDCRHSNQQYLDQHNAEHDEWEGLTDRQRDDRIKQAAG